MIREPLVPLFDLVLCVSDAVDLVSPNVAQHHKQVAYLAQAIAREMGVPHDTRHEIVLAGMLHDIGALSLKERLELLQFETRDPHRHAEIASRLLFSFPRLRKAGELVRFHHLPWDEGAARSSTDSRALESHIIHLADRVAVSIDRKQGILVQAPSICERIAAQRGRLFSPAVVDAFLAAAERECLWLDATSPTLTPALRETVAMDSIELGPDEISRRPTFSDRSSTSAVASPPATRRVAAVAKPSPRSAFPPANSGVRASPATCATWGMAVTRRILEKPGGHRREYSIMRTFHTHTYRTLRACMAWSSACRFHPSLDGSSHPFLKAADLLGRGS